MHKNVSLLVAVTLGALLATSACGPLGQSSDSGDKEKLQTDAVRPAAQTSDAEAATHILIGNTIAEKTTADGCTTDLIQDVTINPKDGNIRAMYSALIPKYAECAGTEKSVVLYISSQKEFNIDSKYGCKIVGGLYAVRCNGPEVKLTSTGRFQATISGDGYFDPDKIKMRMVFEKR